MQRVARVCQRQLMLVIHICCEVPLSVVITFCVSRIDDAKCIVVTRVCVSVCLSGAVRPHYCTDPDVTWGMVEAAPSCALLGGFAIGARVALLWQHNSNPSYKLAYIPQYDDIVRTAGWAGSARAAGR